LVETVRDVLAEIGWSPPGEAPPVKLGTSPEAAAVLSQMRVGEAVDLEELAARTEGPPGALIARLGELEVEGLVARTGGGTFVRLD
jgi:predicted Rossmann fold nucleotide-binding protein DprA/Smf involved in DNA uptake